LSPSPHLKFRLVIIKRLRLLKKTEKSVAKLKNQLYVCFVILRDVISSRGTMVGNPLVFDKVLPHTSPE
jgi:hypothetical protein